MKRIKKCILTLLFVGCLFWLPGMSCKAATVEVSTFAQLKTALEAEGTKTISITSNITLTARLSVVGTKTINGGGHTISRSSSYTDGYMFIVRDSATFTVSNLIIDGKSVAATRGIVLVNEGGTLKVTSKSILRNAKAEGLSSGITNHGTVQVADSTITGCSTEGAGGAISNIESTGAKLTIQGSTTISNNSCSLSGGGVTVYAGTTCEIKSGTFSGNTTKKAGGAIYTNGTLTINGNPTISSNNDIYIASTTSMKISSYTGSSALPIMYGTDKVGTQIIANASKYINNLAWSKNFTNASNHPLVAYGTGIYIGRYITITYSTDSATTCSVKTKKVKWGETYGTLPTPTKTGYTFVGWYTSASGGTKITSTTELKVDSDVTVYARWKANTYTVSFDSNGGSSISTKMTVTYDNTYGTLPTPTKTGYNFVGWFDAKNGSKQYKKGDQVKITADTTFYAKWSAMQITVTFDPNGGTVETKTKTVSYDGTYGTLPTPTRTGYKFGGWYFKNDTTTFCTATDKVTQVTDVTLCAKWTAQTYKVSFSSQNETLSSLDMQVTYGKAYGTLPKVSRNGYTFSGWYLESAFKTLITDTTKVSTAKNHTLYAKWTESQYTVKFMSDGQYIDSYQMKVTYGSTYKTLPTPSRTGYTFLGWYMESTYKTKVLATTKVTATKNHILYAKWKANTYTIHLNANGGSCSISDMTVKYMEKVGTLPIPVKNGYVFSGWYTSGEGGKQLGENSIYSYASDLTLYAKWTRNLVTKVSVSGLNKVYYAGDKIDTKGVTLSVTYANGKTEKVTSGYQVGSYSTSEGERSVVFTYKNKSVSVKCYWYGTKTWKAIKTNKAKVSIYPAGTAKLKVTGAYSLSNCVTYKSSNKSVATVSSSGKITGKKAGKTTISARVNVNGHVKKIKVTVTVKKPVMSLTYVANKKCTKITMKAITKGCTSNVTWSVNKSSIASINKKTGVLKVKKRGTVIVTAKCGNLTKRAKLVIKKNCVEFYTV